jgi:DNA-binding MarR family transcriptional regulator
MDMQSPAELSDRQIEVLVMLSRLTGPLTRQDIAHRLDAESSAARVLRPMIERGVIKEQQLNSDGRMVRAISLTARGRDLAAAIRRTRERPPGV